MLDFMTVATRNLKKDVIEIYPKFLMKRSSDLMIRGSDFYAIWVEERGLWSTDEQDALQLIDNEISDFVNKYNEKHKHDEDSKIVVSYMWDADSGSIDRWHKYCQKQTRDNYHMLDEKLIFSNSETNKKDYASKRLSYPLEPGDCPGYEKLISTLYSPEERHKIEWAIGSIVTGDSKKIQKFMVFYGAAGTGKSTILNIIQQLFEGYYAVFDAKALGSSSNSFALEAFKENPLVAIQHDGDLSRIEDNTRLNSLVSHEMMTINEKFKTAYSNQFKSFLLMGTNRPVKITDAKSGLMRRLIDVSPTGNKLSMKEYKASVKKTEFELGAIACHCRDVYLDDPAAYDDYVPISMLGASNDFYNYMMDSYHVFKKEDGTTLKTAWEMYKTYCDEAKLSYPFSQRNFKEELKNYFWDFKERLVNDNGERLRSYYIGFRTDKFEDGVKDEIQRPDTNTHTIKFDAAESIFDKECADCLAQYASSKETPSKKWENVKTKLSSVDTSKLHYVRVPENHIVIDFDLKNEKGEKDFDLNLAAASTWPATYAELSKSGAGIHLHYIFAGDPYTLSRVYDDNIEVKVFTGNSSLRRKLTKCNNEPIAIISSGLPLKGDDKLINWDGIKNEKMLRTMIKRNLNKEYHPGTKPSIDYIYKLLNEDSYDKGLTYDVSDMKNAVLAFALQSTNHSDYCLDIYNKMKFKSEDPSSSLDETDADIVFFDCEVFPNLFLVNWKIAGEGNPIVRMINPKPKDIEELARYRLVGFNCRRYDNHMLYACMIGYTNEQIYDLSQKIVSSGKGAKGIFFGEAYNLSYTDIYDFAATKQSLKKWEIELGIHHQELGLPWDQPVPEERWDEVAGYCDNDVIATEAVFNHLQGDFKARQILAIIAGKSVNDTTNSLTTQIIFGSEKKPPLVYTDLATGESTDGTKSKANAYPGYEYKDGKNLYRGTDLGFGGYVYAEPGMYTNVALLDVASLHPHSVLAMNCFGKYTKNFEDLLQARIAIKHKDFDKAKQMLDGKLVPYLDDPAQAKELSKALKIAINSVYGLTSANFDNPFRDNRNKNNIVALRGALFMRTLQDEVVKKGFQVAHIKTDSIKIPNATPDIIKFCMDFAKEYGYTFEHEATYERMCLVNNAVYVAKYADAKSCEKMYGYVPEDCEEEGGKWTATGTQFQIPYVFKKLFSKEPIEFEDMCETKSVTSSLYLDMNEKLPDVSQLEKDLEKTVKKAKDFGVEMDLSGNSGDGELDSMIEEINAGHNYIFIGKVGLFCPIKPGCGGGLLMREKDGKYYSATGAKDYRWLEAEMVKTLNKEDDIDRSYYDNLVNDAVESISEYGDFEWFVSGDKVPLYGVECCPWCKGSEDEDCEKCPYDVR